MPAPLGEPPSGHRASLLAVGHLSDLPRRPPRGDNYQSDTDITLIPSLYTHWNQMDTKEELAFLIDQASKIVGSQRKLAEALDLQNANLIQMKNGERPCNWRVRGKLRVILGEDPTHAFMAAMAEDLAESENEVELAAARNFQTMLAAFPDEKAQTKNPADLSMGGVSEGWRKRRDSNPR